MAKKKAVEIDENDLSMFLSENVEQEQEIEEVQDVLDTEMVKGNKNDAYSFPKQFADSYVFWCTKYDRNGTGKKVFEGIKTIRKNQFLRFGAKVEENTFVKNLKTNFKGGVLLINAPE
jgi:hypothetical protein